MNLLVSENRDITGALGASIHAEAMDNISDKKGE